MPVLFQPLTRVIPGLVLLALAAVAAAQDYLDPEDFRDRYVETLRVLAPELEVEVTGELQLSVAPESGEALQILLYNAYQSYLASPEALDEVIRSYAAAMVEGWRSMDAPVERSRLVPVVKDRDWLDDMRKAVTPAASGAEAASYTQVVEPLNDTLVIVYAEDTPTRIRYIDDATLQALGVDPGELRELAIDNLSELLPELARREGEGVYMLVADGVYEASLLLLDDIWTKQNFPVRGDIVVAVPSRDVLLVSGTDEQAGMATLREIAADAYATSPYRLTLQAFVRRQGQWTEYRP